MSEIHFDQDGEPNEPHANCTEVRWRYFPRPGTRGAPRIVHDKRNGGAPLYTQADISYLELRDLVDGMAGYYRGDQVDQGRRLIPGAKPFYVSIDATPRNAANATTSDELVRHLVESNTRQSETLINQLSAVMREQRKAMKETRKVMRVLATSDLRDMFRRFAGAEAARADDDDEHDDDEEQDAGGAGEGVVKDIKDITHQVFSAFETWMLDRAAQRAQAANPAAPAAQPATAPASPPPVAAPPPPVAAPPPSASPPPPAAPPPAGAPPSSAAPVPDAPATMPASSAPSPTASPSPEPAPATEIRNAASPMPTPEQAQHLIAILNALRPDERTVARTVVHRMTAEQRTHWLTELSALSVDQAVELVRSMIPARTKKETES